MKAKWKKSWIGSKQPRKQRKYRYNAPLHIKQSFLRSLLSKELRKKYNTRNVRVRTGDKVKIMRGQFSKKTGKVEKVSIKESRVYVTGIESLKKDGSKALYPIHASNIIIEDLDTSDKKRRAKLEGGVPDKNEVTSEKTPSTK